MTIDITDRVILHGETARHPMAAKRVRRTSTARFRAATDGPPFDPAKVTRDPRLTSR